MCLCVLVHLPSVCVSVCVSSPAICLCVCVSDSTVQLSMCVRMYVSSPAVRLQQHASHVVVQNADTAVRQLVAKAVLVTVVDPLGHPQLTEVLYGRRHRVYSHPHTAGH